MASPHITLAFLSLAWLTSANAQSGPCFDIALPSGAKESTVPATLSFATNSATRHQPGFSIYHSGQNLALNGPGCFSLKQDIVRNVGMLGKFIAEPGGAGPMIGISGSDIDLNLNAHSIISNRASHAIHAGLGGMLNEPKKKNYVLRNGKINVGGNGIAFVGWQYGGQPHYFRPGSAMLELARTWYGPNFKDFEDTNILLENLTIKSGGLAVFLVGRKNIIRNCRIEVEGYEALALFGAENQLINNEILVKRSGRPPKITHQPPARLNIGSYYEEYAAIWVRDAPGLVIKGNRIKIEGIFDAKEAFLLVNSPGVIIEDNEVIGADKIYTALDTHSSAHIRNNRKRFGRWPEN